MDHVTLINRLVIKPGMIDDFIAAQRRVASSIPEGLVSGRLYRNTDGTSVILLSQFASTDAQQKILQNDEFKEHLKKMASMVDSSSPLPYEEAYTYGDFK
jgi:heme-degrading monooxygenase HmoA